jgi:uncharacterized RDD family membrane protein YckC
MKCPKCDYLGFETGERCRNCGYDFSLLAGAPLHHSGGPDPDLDLRLRDDGPPRPPSAFRGEPSLPLFSPSDSDEPLVKLPASPRPPLSVRRTPDAPRFRAARAREIEPTLVFADEPADAAPVVRPDPDVIRPAVEPRRGAATRERATSLPATGGEAAPGRLGQRALAAIVDHALLLAIDAGIVYFTLRIAMLSWTDWRLLPPAPMAAFLLLIDLAYFSAFTAVGGQTIGKMAAGIRVIADDDRLVDPARAVRRALAGLLSALTLGAGYIPALVGPDRRTLHDRLARTRVIGRRPA